MIVGNPFSFLEFCGYDFIFKIYITEWVEGNCTRGQNDTYGRC